MLAHLSGTICLKHSATLILPPLSKPPSRRTCLIIISKLFFTALPIPSSDTLCVCVCVWSVCVCVCQCVCVCVCVVSVIVKRHVLPPSVVDRRSRNLLYYFIINCVPVPHCPWEEWVEAVVGTTGYPLKSWSVGTTGSLGVLLQEWALDCCEAAVDFIQHAESCCSSALFQGGPVELLQHLLDACSFLVPIQSKSSCPALCGFQSVDVFLCCRVSHSAAWVLEDGARKGLVGLCLDVGFPDPQVTSQKPSVLFALATTTSMCWSVSKHGA